MKKLINSIVIFLVVISIGVINVNAENIDTTKSSSLYVTYQYDNVVLTDADISIYYLASINADGTYTFTSEYASVAFDTTDISSSSLTLQAETINNYIVSSSLSAYEVIATDTNGNASFSNLMPGLYLIVVEDVVLDNNQYYASPTIISIPTIENNTYLYDITVNIKTEKKELSVETTVDGDTTDTVIEEVPNTFDNIYFYVILLVISVVVIFAVEIFIIKKRGKKNNGKRKKSS